MTPTRREATYLPWMGALPWSPAVATPRASASPPRFLAEQGTTVAGVRFVAGGFTLALGLVLLSLGREAETGQDRGKCYGWAAWFLVLVVLQCIAWHGEARTTDPCAGVRGPGRY